MKKLLLSLMLVSMFYCGGAIADTTCTATWDANAASDNVIGYRLYDNMQEISDVTGLTSTVVVADGAHSFTVTCYNKNGESLHSAPVVKTFHTAKPGQVGNVKVTIIIEVTQ